jgi:hypothetical protein
MNHEALKAEYVELLKNIDTSYLDVPNKRPKGLSGLFLASVANGYSQAKNKVMIVGRETTGWEPLAKQDGDKDSYDDFQSIDSYIDRAMQKHLLFFEKMLKQIPNDRGCSFHNFTRAAAKVVGEDSLIYTNLFCFDWRRKSPIKSPQFDFIKDLSGKILDAQIKVLQPEYIIFANGVSTVKYRREFFPVVGAGARCTNPKSYPEIVSSHYLWEFMLDTKIKCFRTHHPVSYTHLRAHET